MALLRMGQAGLKMQLMSEGDRPSWASESPRSAVARRRMSPTASASLMSGCPLSQPFFPPAADLLG